MSELAALIQQRERCKGSINRLRQFASTISNQDTSQVAVSARLEVLELTWREFINVDDRIAIIEGQVSQVSEYEGYYFTIRTACEEAISATDPLPDRTSNGDDLNATMARFVEQQRTIIQNMAERSSHHSDVRLPRINIPAFSGNYRDWPAFKDLFVSSIHDNNSLSNGSKFQYLKGLLRGEAAGLVKHLQVTDSNYDQAWNKLNERYDRTKNVINSYIKLFVELSPVGQLSSSSLRRISDGADEVIRALQALSAPANSRDPWLIFLLLSKLDSETRQLWAVHSSSNDHPTFDDLIKFLNLRCDALESTQIGQNRKPFSSNRQQSNVNLFNSETGSGSICVYCNRKFHSISKCFKFKANSVAQRKQFVSEKNLCSNCLKDDHLIANCKSPIKCSSCNQHHHSLLHPNSRSVGNVHTVQAENLSLSPSPSTSELNIAHVTSTNTKVGRTANFLFHSMLPTAVINVKDSMGNYQSCRILLDSGSQATFISERCVQRLALKRENAKIAVWGVSATNAGFTRGKVNLSVRSRFDSEPVICFPALILSRLTSDLPSSPIDSAKWDHIKSLKLADPSFGVPQRIDIILGADNFFRVLSSEKILSDSGIPLAQNSIFGWIIISGLMDPGASHHLSIKVSSSHVGLDMLLRKFWEIEEPDVLSKGTTEEEDFCERHFRENSIVSKDSKFLVRLPIRDFAAPIGNSFSAARSRLLSMEKKFRGDTKLHADYCKFMSEYENLGHMSIIPESEVSVDDSKCFYLPHHAVIRECSSTTKLRVVFDGSCRSSTGISLNDTLAVGPTIQRDLLSILLSFRVNKIAFTADIEKMYRQVNVDQRDQNMQRILWRNNFNTPFQHYRLATVTYGTACAPFLATRSLYQVSLDMQATDPSSAQIIRDDFYVDDLISGCQSVHEAISLQKGLSQSLSRYGFHLRKWSSNSLEFLGDIPESERENSSLVIDSHSEFVKILGLHWCPLDDSFSFKVSVPSLAPNTKRSMLSESSKMFDPLGFLAPCTIKIKIMFQQLWLEKYGWDDPLPDSLMALWTNMRCELKLLETLRIPRWLHLPSEIQLHAFSDASESAYAATVYCRSIGSDGKCHVNLIMAKTRVAPLKQVSLPRLELCAAHLLVQTIKPIQTALKIPTQCIVAWTDSSIVLAWLSSHPRKWKNFVANRTTKIIDCIPRHQWHHVASKQNPADIASRGILPSQLLNNSLWWHGPHWLSDDLSKWPSSDQNASSNDTSLEVRNKTLNINTTATIIEDSFISKLFENISSFTKILRIICYCKRFINHLRKTKPTNNFITASEFSLSINLCIKWAQADIFSPEINLLKKKHAIPLKSSISSLHPFIDDDGVLRVGGRIGNSSCPFETKHPAILPKRHIFSSRLITYLHLKHLHADISLLTTIIKQKYWIIGSRNMVKKSIHKCLICLRHRQTTSKQLMADLPQSRVSPGRPFQHTGVDYAGPVKIKTHSGRSYQISKGYIVVFICFSIKAIHLEIAVDLTSDTFIRALHRFVSRRGIPSDMHSDNGTNFVGAIKKLYCIEDIKNPSSFNGNISKFIMEQKITWHFIPPSSPHFGGLWEAGVKSVKTHLSKSFGETLLTFEEFSTALCQIEALLNSRPLCPVNESDLNILTPSHFLTGIPFTSLPENSNNEKKLPILTKWNFLQKIKNDFWKRWQLEYLTSLQNRKKWTKGQPNFNVGDIVIIKEENLPPSKWALGRVIETHPGADNLVRVVTLKTSAGICKRPIVKLCRLPVVESPQREEHVQASNEATQI